jgi:hypothetical protein
MKTTVYEEKLDYDSSPLKFRNYLALSMKENTSVYSFIDNEFYISSAKEMDYKHFLGQQIPSKTAKFDYQKPFKRKSSFYIKINRTNSMKYKSYVAS